MNRLSVWGKNSEDREGKGWREPVDKHLRLLFRPLVIILPIIVIRICQSISRVSNSWENYHEMSGVFVRLKTEWNSLKWSASLIVDFAKSRWSPVRELIGCRSLAFQEDRVVLAQAFESLKFPLEQGESFSDLSCFTCARQAVRLGS